MGGAYFVETWERDEGRDVASHPMGAPHSGTQVVAWNCHTRRVMVLFQDWPWVHLASSGTASSWTRAAYNRITENDDHFYWNSIDFHVIEVLPKASKFDAHRYVSVILQSLTDWHIGEIGTADGRTNRASWQFSTSQGQGVIDFHWAEYDGKDATSAILVGFSTRKLVSFRLY
jgi:hypothetical protein